MTGIDQHIEQPDDDFEPREPPCRECGGSEGDHAIGCSYAPDAYENPFGFEIEDIPCGGD